jgi:hypothetical protein
MEGQGGGKDTRGHRPKKLHGRRKFAQPGHPDSHPKCFPNLIQIELLLAQIERGLSSGQQHYVTDPDLYPVNQPIPKIESQSQCTGETRGRCYGHNFLRFLPIFGEKIAFFSKLKVMIKFLQKLTVWAKNINIFAKFFGGNILKIL